MRKLDWAMLAIGLIGALTWSIVSGKDGFKGNNATIVARSISITATIDGQVDNDPPMVGARVSTSDLLVSIHNSRIDRSRLVAFESDIEYLQHEIKNAKVQHREFSDLLNHYQERASAHSSWMLKDIGLQNMEKAKLLEVAEQNKKLSADKLNRAMQLHERQLASAVELDIAQIEAEIATSEVDLTRAGLRRSELLHRSVKSNGMFFDNGDASYWDKMVDELRLRQVDKVNQIASLKAQLVRAQSLAEVERSRIGSSIEEEHRAPFEGMVNATYVSNGTRVNSGTSLLQVLNCSNPIVIVPIPEHRMGEFSVGMDVTVYPLDTESALPGKIRYISSGPLIGHDQTLLVQENLTVSGVHAVISFSEAYEDTVQTCEPAHKAVVVIHTKSSYGSITKWVASAF